MATALPHIPSAERTPADFGMAAEDVSYLSGDGVELRARYVPAESGTAVILRHGAGSAASSVLPQAAVLARNGFGVLITDARGHGRSGGQAMDFGWFGDADIEAAASFLIGRPEIDPRRVAVLGLSMGGEEAIGAAAHDPRIAGVVAEGATARVAEDKSWLADVYGVRGRIQIGLESVQYAFADLLTSASRPTGLAEAARRAAPTPILLITGGDVPDERNAAEHIREGSPNAVIIWSVPGARHTAGLSVAPAEWEKTVVEFLMAALPDQEH